MSPKKIVIWDDDKENAEEWASRIRDMIEEINVGAQGPKELETEISELVARQGAFLKGGEREKCEIAFDDADVAIIDNDLFELDRYAGLTAETAAYLARVYTSCKIIVVVNLTTDIDFDLSLKGHPESKADLHINDKVLDNPGLWSECPRRDSGYRPWHWPLLLDAPEQFAARQEGLVQLLSREPEKTILDYFGFDQGARDRLSRSARGFLHPKIPAEEVTFFDFVTGNGNAVDPKEEKEGQKLMEVRDVEMIARICAARLHKWFERLVLGPQDILVDLPHLVQRFPFLLPESGREDVNIWNQTVNLREICGLSDPGLVEFARFAAPDWVSRPLFWWPRLEEKEDLSDLLLKESKGNPCDFVFREDTSNFGTRESSHSFVAAFHSAFDQRYVSRPDDAEEIGVITYAPQSRLAR